MDTRRYIKKGKRATYCASTAVRVRVIETSTEDVTELIEAVRVTAVEFMAVAMDCGRRVAVAGVDDESARLFVRTAGPRTASGPPPPIIS